MGNGEAKELICMIHGHELRWENAGRRRGTGQKGIKGEKLRKLKKNSYFNVTITVNHFIAQVLWAIII